MKYSSPANKMSDSELSDYSHEHLRYEIWMFFNSGLKLTRSQFDENDADSVFTKNILVESFSNHLRNLLLFFYPYSPEREDVLSDYFFCDLVEDWKKKRPKETDSLRNARTRTSQEISHLTTFRREPNDESKMWPVVTLMREVKAVLQPFVDNASRSKLSKSVVELVNKINLDSATGPLLLTVVNTTTTAPLASLVLPPQSTDPITSVSSSSPPVKRG